MGSDSGKREIRLAIAGGGTGGHLFPGVAAAREISSRHAGAKILFITGEKQMEARIVERSGYRRETIRVEGLKGRGWRKGVLTLLALPRSFIQARRILRDFGPGVVLGVGGYSAGPVCVAARWLRIPTAAHEQNSFPGLTNRLLSRIVNRVFISFEESRSRFPGGCLVFTGNPVREEILSASPRAIPMEGNLSLLVVGGSQGALAVNTAVVAALERLKKQGRWFDVLHQTGEADYERVLRLYTDLGIRGSVTPFIEDMARGYANADLVVGRAGAGTVSELAALGRPSVLIPFPYAANDHQTTNARVLSDAGGAELLMQADLDGDSLARILARFDDDREALAHMGRRAAEKGRRGAARAMAEELEILLERGATGS